MISAWTERNRIKASYRDAAGVLSIRDIGPAEYTAFVRDPNALRHDSNIIDRRPDRFAGWTRLEWTDYEARKQALIQNPTALFEADVSPVRRFLTDHNCKIDAPRRAYLDIETDSRVPFSSAVMGGTRLLSWALVDEEGNRMAELLQDDHPQAEAELWVSLWHCMADYCQIASWNGDGFDFQVMKANCEALAKRYSKMFEPYWANRRRIQFVDMLACFRRHHMAAESGDDKTSFRLGDVCQALIGEGKTDFESGKTWEAWEAGGAARQELLAYNIQDTALLPKLEAETGYLELQQTLAEVTLTFVNSHNLKPSPQIDGYLLRLAHKRGTHLISKRVERETSGEQYDGAFVLKPTSLGLHRDVHVCDFKSLYPTVIRTFNIGPDTKGVGAERCKAFGTDVEYDTTVEGMISIACEEGMRLREFWKQEYKKDPNNKAAERHSKAYKIFNNSMYGWLGNSYARFYDPQVAESVTACAKELNERTAAAATARGWSVIYMDTDSLFVKGCTVEEFKEFVTTCNRELYPAVLAERNVPPARQCIELDYEKCFDRLVFPLGQNGTPAAKRYAGSYKHYGFKPKTKPEIRGLEYMRTDGTSLARRLQKELIDLILSGQDSPDFYHAWVKRKRELFFDEPVELEDVVLSKGISRPLAAYRSKGPHVRLAEILAAEGEDVSEGTRISYVVSDALRSPMEVISADAFDGTNLDRWYYWARNIYPCLMRVLAGAFPNQPWSRWIPKRPKPVLPGQLSLLM